MESLQVNRLTRTRGRGHRPGEAGFSLMEILIAILIVSMLTTILVVAVRGQRERARIAATQALIEQIRLSLQEYFRVMGHFPPDGIDTPVNNDMRTKIQSGACLYNFLCLPVKKERPRPAGRTEIVTVGPFLSTKDLHLSEEIELGAQEILDVFGNPIHYDNLEGANSYSPQMGEVHLLVPEAHGQDPREVATEDSLFYKTGPQNDGSYDLWSHGESGHTDAPLASDTIGNWQKRVE